MIAPPPDPEELEYVMTSPVSDENSTDTPDVDRNPLGKVALAIGGVVASLAAILSALVQLGVLTVAQAQAVSTVADQLPGLTLTLGVVVAAVMAAVGTLVGAFATARIGRHSVTPLADPRDNAGRPLLPVSLPGQHERRI